MNFWYQTCHFCHQGRLWIARDLVRGLIYLHCDECGHGWADPDRVADPDASFLTVEKGFEMEFLDEKSIDEGGWSAYRRQPGIP